MCTPPERVRTGPLPGPAEPLGALQAGPAAPFGAEAERAAGLRWRRPPQPTEVLALLKADGLSRIYSLRLAWPAGEPAHVVESGPFALERTYDARMGERLDPLPGERLWKVANGELVDTRAAAVERAPEFNRYYTVAEVPAVRVHMEGAQPSELVLSEASGRILSRADPLAAWFERAYLSVHVWQRGDAGRRLERLDSATVRRAADAVVRGEPAEYWMDFDRRIPTYLYRFDDPDRTGEVVQ